MIISNGGISICFNPLALRKVKIIYNFGLSECKRVNYWSLSNSQCDKFVNSAELQFLGDLFLRIFPCRS